jgi:arginine exporter protein ArgO
MNLNAATILSFVGYAISGLVTCAGIAALAGWLMPSYIPDNIRIILGIMFILYGAFRGATTWMKQQHAKRFAERSERDWIQ